MTIQNWDEFWWNSITGPHVAVTKVSEALIDDKNVVLSVPADLPWRHSMRSAIHDTFRDRLDSDDVVIELLDAVDDIPEDIEPGRFILSQFASSTISRGYREKSKNTIQEYIAAKKVLKNRVLWIKGLGGHSANQWIDFCQEYKQSSLENGLFVLEVQEQFLETDIKSLQLIEYSSLVSNYDVQLFNSFILDAQDKHSDSWKKYIAVVAATLCETDAEISAEFLEQYDFLNQSPIDCLVSIAESQLFSRRGSDEGSTHILRYCRNGEITELEHRIWSAQVQVLFPIIELGRISIIEKWREKIQEALSFNTITQYGEVVKEAKDVELGTLCYMMKHNSSDGYFILFIPDKDARDRVVFLHSCRNKLAHASCCTSEEVRQLLEYN